MTEMNLHSFYTNVNGITNLSRWNMLYAEMKYE